MYLAERGRLVVEPRGGARLTDGLRASVDASTRTASAIADLRARFGERVSTSRAVLDQHGTDESWHEPAPPDAVVFASSTEDVVHVVRTCAQHGVPLVPYGVGTSLEGHIGAIEGGVCLDLFGMDRILEVNVDDLDCRVEAGVRRNALNERLRRDGLFFPIDPGADATLGGMCATRASGTNAVRYGTMRDNVLGLTVVLANGEIIRAGSRARKSSAGYDLTALFVGSEGTLGVIIEVTLRLYGIPDCIGVAICSFATLAGAVRTVIETIQLGIPVARVELLDDVQVDACNRHSGLALPERPLLLVEFHGTTDSVPGDAAAVEALAAANDGDGWTWSTDRAERDRLWKARHDAYYAARALRPDASAVITDVGVPISRLAECIEETRADIERAGLTAPIFGHAGDGNFHVMILFDPNDAEEVRAAHGLHDRMVERALAADGTCTGEHGIGRGKVRFMADEHGPGAIHVMRSVRSALDPAGILNPGKVLRA